MEHTPIYFIDGELIAESGDIRIYKFEGDTYLEGGQGHRLWTISNEIKAYRDQIRGLPRGDCLEIGLGLGVCSAYILGHKKVKSLTSVELSPDVIKLYKQMNKVDPRHTLICGDGLDYIIQTDSKFDFIFLDFYSLIDEDTIEELKVYVSTSRRILNEGGTIHAWLDIYTPDEFKEEFLKLF
jgi:hypothetical protein